MWLIARVYTTWQVVENCVLQISTTVSLSELDHDCTREGNTVLRKRRLWLPATRVDSQPWIDEFRPSLEYFPLSGGPTHHSGHIPTTDHPQECPEMESWQRWKIMGAYHRSTKDSVPPPFPLSLPKWLLMEKNVSENIYACDTVNSSTCLVSPLTHREMHAGADRSPGIDLVHQTWGLAQYLAHFSPG